MGHLLEIKCIDSRVNVHIFASTCVSFTLTTVQVTISTNSHEADNSALLQIEFWQASMNFEEERNFLFTKTLLAK
jgi:hypothetical protein